MRSFQLCYAAVLLKVVCSRPAVADSLGSAVARELVHAMSLNYWPSNWPWNCPPCLCRSVIVAWLMKGALPPRWWCDGAPESFILLSHPLQCICNGFYHFFQRIHSMAPKAMKYFQHSSCSFLDCSYHQELLAVHHDMIDSMHAQRSRLVGGQACQWPAPAAAHMHACLQARCRRPRTLRINICSKYSSVLRISCESLLLARSNFQHDES